jgi:hypothetical protein
MFLGSCYTLFMRYRFMCCRRAVGCFVLIAVTIIPSPSLAQGPLIPAEGKVLLAVGSWLLGYIGGKVADKAIALAQGKDNEKTLDTVVATLNDHLKQNSADKEQVEGQLKMAKTQLRILRQLMAGVPNPKQLAKDREQLESDLTTIRSMLAEHEKRLDEHDQHLADNDRRLSALESEHRGYASTPSTTPGQAPSPNSPQAGGRLTIEVRGRGNLIRLRVATHPVYMGTFRLKSVDGQADYSIPPEALAVIELFAPASRISMPQSLVHQVQILSHGFSYQTQLY